MNKKRYYYHADKVECDFIAREDIHITAVYQLTRSLANEDKRERIQRISQCFKSLQSVRRNQEEESIWEIEEKNSKQQESKE